jgi:EAL domain-containing protein (putative c-di-GMP-specific phosphodiesterase class I)
LNHHVINPAKPAPDRQLRTRLILAVALSYAIDGLILTGFAAAGVISFEVPLLYTLAGLSTTAAFWLLRMWALKHDFGDGEFALSQVIVASALLLSFAAATPPLAFYFFTVLFVVFGCGSLGLSGRQSAIAWVAVAIAAAMTMSAVHARIVIPQDSTWARTLVLLCFVATLGRCILLGSLARSLRMRLQDRRRQLRESVRMLEERDKSLAQVNLELKRQATHNALTGIANRVLFVEQLQRAVVQPQPFAVCVFDLDRFKIINDSLGHGAGDALLKHVSDRLLSITRASDTVARADEAMYYAKRTGRNTFRFFDSSVMGFSRERLEIEAELRGALAQGQLVLHYQPKIDIASSEMRSVEALIRWNHPTRGAVLPGEFIPIAEESGLILEIGDWVIREACRQASEWQRQGMPFLRVAVNVSPLQFRQANFVKKLSAALKEFSLEATFLEIELTEATLMSNAESSVTLLNELSQLGVVVAVDDFGTGYSSMSYLQRFPIDKLKIDRSFISDVASNAGDASIVRAIISLAHGLRLKVIAEGVESEQQLGILRRMGCDQYQGFYRSAAVPACDIERFARRDQRLQPHGETDIDRTQSKLFRLREA